MEILTNQQKTHQNIDRGLEGSKKAINTSLNICTEEQFIQSFLERMNTNDLWSHDYFKIIDKIHSVDILKNRAIQAGKIDEAFVEILSNMIKNPSIPQYCHDDINENLQDELGHGNEEQEHFTLFKNVLDIVGVDENTYRNTPNTPGTQKIIDSLKTASLDQKNPLRILSLMASEETICPKEFPIFLEILKIYTNDESKLEYFPVHIEADVEHANDLIGLCHKYCKDNNISLEKVYSYQKEDLQNNIEFYDDLLKQVQQN